MLVLDNYVIPSVSQDIVCISVNILLNFELTWYLRHSVLIGIDVGAAQLIIDGRIDVKSGVELARFAENGTTVEFTDGSTLDVDVVIFA